MIENIPLWRARGYQVKLFYLSLPNAEVAVARVAARVAQGGHWIPEDVIRRRFATSAYNFQRLYKTLVNAWAFYDNSGPQPVLLEKAGEP